MGKEIKIICDGCGRDITYTGNSIDWRLALRNEEIPSYSGTVTDMYIPPQIDKDVYFCGIECLKKWLKTK